MKKICILFSISIGLLSAVSAQISFTKITDAEPVKKLGDWRSVNWVDYNNDGWLDLFISQGPESGANNALFKNNKNGSFSTIINDPIVSDNTPSDGATWGDMDNDGDLDAFVVNWYGVNNLDF
jgi:enediyne biosynthesis protein E4